MYLYTEPKAIYAYVYLSICAFEYVCICTRSPKVCMHVCIFEYTCICIRSQKLYTHVCIELYTHLIMINIYILNLHGPYMGISSRIYTHAHSREREHTQLGCVRSLNVGMDMIDGAALVELAHTHAHTHEHTHTRTHTHPPPTHPPAHALVLHTQVIQKQQ